MDTAATQPLQGLQSFFQRMRLDHAFLFCQGWGHCLQARPQRVPVAQQRAVLGKHQHRLAHAEPVRKRPAAERGLERDVAQARRMLAGGQHHHAGRGSLHRLHHARRGTGHAAGVFHQVLRHLPGAQQAGGIAGGGEQHGAWRCGRATGQELLHLATAVLHHTRRFFGAGRHRVAPHREVHARRHIADGQQVRGQVQQRRVFGNPGVDGGVVKKTEFTRPLHFLRYRPAPGGRLGGTASRAGPICQRSGSPNRPRPACPAARPGA